MPSTLARPKRTKQPPPNEADEVVSLPDYSQIIVEDGEPVDSRFTEIQQRLLVEPLYGSWTPADGRPFRAYCNVGLFHAVKAPPVCPDAMLVMGVPPSPGVTEPEHRSYFMWIVGKPPDVVIEIVSDTRGGEDSTKLDHYFAVGVSYVVVFDPLHKLSQTVLRAYSKNGNGYHPADPAKLGSIGLGFKLWDGTYENERATWLRWVDADDRIIPTTKERADAEAKEAMEAKHRARLAEQRADEAERKNAELIAKLRQLEGTSSAP